jgi:hypothetical protein
LGKTETKEKREEKGVRDYCVGKEKNEEKGKNRLRLSTAGFLQLAHRRNKKISEYSEIAKINSNGGWQKSIQTV